MTTGLSASEPLGRSRITIEVVIVLGLSLGASAVYSIVSLLADLTEGPPLADQSTSINPPRATREWLDFTYQFLAVFFALFAVALVLYLLADAGRNPFRRIGLDLTRPGRDALAGLALAAAIGIPGIALYGIGRAAGITLEVQASSGCPYWWSIPMLVLSALRAALTEEVIVVGYLFTRLRQLGWSTWTTIVSTALLRGSYHLYQGFGPFIGNALMGVVFGWCYARWGRVMPLVVAHVLLDVVSFVGYPIALAAWPAFFGAR
jgi:membrane protease YdiL (CAAX protease family)